MPRADRLAYLGLAVAVVVCAALLLWTSRGFTFFNDEIGWFSTAPPDYDPAALLQPHNSHLIAVPRLIYTLSLDLFGPAYLPLRLVGVLGVLLCGGLFYVLARRRVGAGLALAPTVVLLFFGTAWNVIVSPIGIPFVYATALGVGALVALDRQDRRGDIGACLLIVASLAAHSIGASFLVGIAVSVLLREDRLRRAWVFVVPLALFAAWWLVFSGSGSGRDSIADVSNVLGLPRFMFASLGAVLTAVTGLNIGLDPSVTAGFDRPPAFQYALVPVLALAGLVAFGVRLWRGGRGGPDLWVFLAALLTFWVSIGISAGEGRAPVTERYLFPGAVMLLLVVVEAARGVRPSRPAVIALCAVAAVSVGVNVVHTQEARRFLIAYANNIKPTLAMIELAGENGAPDFRPGQDAPGASPMQVGVTSSVYLRGASSWGSIASSIEEVRGAAPIVRDRADVVLARSLQLSALPAPSWIPARGCRPVSHSAADRFTGVTLPPGGGVLRVLGGEGGEVRLRRFGDSFSASAGSVIPGRRMLLDIPRDTANEPWQASVPAGRLELCPPPTEEARAKRYCAVARRLEESRGRAPETRALFAELTDVVPAEIRSDLKTVIAGAVASRPEARAIGAAQRRIDAFEDRRCGR